MAQIDDLRRKVLEDRDFRQLLVNKPEEALRIAGIKATPQNVALVKNVVAAIQNLYAGCEEIDEFIT